MQVAKAEDYILECYFKVFGKKKPFKSSVCARYMS
jgi:hypothetical protein